METEREKHSSKRKLPFQPSPVKSICRICRDLKSLLILSYITVSGEGKEICDLLWNCYLKVLGRAGRVAHLFRFVQFLKEDSRNCKCFLSGLVS